MTNWTYSGLAYKASAALAELDIQSFHVSLNAAIKIIQAKRLEGIDSKRQRWVVKFAGLTTIVSDRELIALTLDTITTKKLTIFDGKAVSI